MATKGTTQLKLADIRVDEQEFSELKVTSKEIAPYNQVPNLNIFLMQGPHYITTKHNTRFERELEIDYSNDKSDKFIRNTVIGRNLSYIVALGNPIYDWSDYIGHSSENWHKHNFSISWSCSRLKGQSLISIVKRNAEGSVIQRSDYHNGKLVKQVHILHHSVKDGEPLELHKDPKKLRLFHDMLCEIVTTGAQHKESKENPIVLGIHCASGIGRTGVAIVGVLLFLRHDPILAKKLPLDTPIDPVELIKWLREKSGRHLLLASLTGQGNVAQFKDAIELAKALEIEHAHCLVEKEPRKKVSELVQLTKEEQQFVLQQAENELATQPFAKTLFVFNIDKNYDDGIDRRRLQDQCCSILRNGGEVAFHTKNQQENCFNWYTNRFPHRMVVQKQGEEKLETTIKSLLNNYSNITRVVYYCDDEAFKSNLPTIASVLQKENITFHARVYLYPEELAKDLEKKPFTDVYENTATEIKSEEPKGSEIVVPFTQAIPTQQYVAPLTFMPPPSNGKETAKTPLLPSNTDKTPCCPCAIL